MRAATRVWSVDDYVDFQQELLDHLQITHVSFIAHSFGARIALRYAYRFPVEKMVRPVLPAFGQSALGYHIRVKTYKLGEKTACQSLPWEAVIIRVLQQS